MEQNNISSKQIWFGILLVVLLTAGYFVADQFAFNKESAVREQIVKEVVKEVILKKPSCTDTTESFSALKNSGQIVTLVKNLNTYGENGAFVNSKFTIVKSTGSGSQIACGYLYVKGHGENGRPLQVQWEHPYVKPGQFGGHIETKNSVIPQTDGKTNEFLFNLSKIDYKLSNSDTEIRRADWAALLNVSDRIQFEVSLNTIDKAGILEEVSIAYQCWSPETGQITQDCRLSIE